MADEANSQVVAQEPAPQIPEQKQSEDLPAPAVQKENFESPKAPEEAESPVQLLIKKQAELEAKLADLESRNAELEARKQELDAQSRLDKAQAEGWLLPAQLKESEGQESVFVELARNQPELFDRLRLVLAPKSIPKKSLTEVPPDTTSAGPLTDDEKFNRISALAKERGISYAAATKLLCK